MACLTQNARMLEQSTIHKKNTVKYEEDKMCAPDDRLGSWHTCRTLGVRSVSSNGNTVSYFDMVAELAIELARIC
eukprot:1881120-Amphidinium_carterae.1